ncbi:hypothetical protein LWI28_025393 [Acer negundo]|uniref:F-box domain-containing protein n=1 Tax=Acer negundo TaxID=4023 RepID=A0AAD5P4U6_ACENE|nr:hypothetical protein LWI28_025393 [Acer negundo]
MDFGSFGKQYKGEDIISRMPDDVLSHIISRLEAKDAFKTCVLSTRWKNVWTLIYNLCFRDGYGGNSGTMFVNFVEFVLHRCQSNNIQNFHLRTGYELQESDADRLTDLICFAVDARNVSSLTLKFNVEGENPMISNSLQKLFRSCPTLEELKIKGWHDIGGNVLTFDITKPTLKKLKIDLSATVCSVLGETPFLNKVILDGKVDRRLLHGESLTKPVSEFFRAINSTRFLRLDIKIMSVLSRDLYGNLPSFPNLIYLHLGIGVFIGYALMVQFLNNSPNLEVLVLDKEDADSYRWDDIVLFEFELECVPSCMLLHLKEIYIFIGEDKNLQDLEVIKRLLGNSIVLERFSVNFYLSFGEHLQGLQDAILSYPMVSPICKIDFSDDRCWNTLWSKFYKYR